MHKQGFYVKLASLVLLTSFSLWLLYPTYRFYALATPEEQKDHKLFCASMPKFMHCHKVVLGLDLQGGLHLVMGVIVDKAVSDKVERLAEAVGNRLKEKNISLRSVDHRTYESNAAYEAVVRVALEKKEDIDKFKALVREEFRIFEAPQKAQEEGTFLLTLLKQEEMAIKNEAVEQAIKTIRNRADKYGVSEPVIARRGQDSILIELPGVKDPERAIDIIGKTAQLEFSIVDDNFDGFQNIDLPPTLRREFERVDTKEGPARRAFLISENKEALIQFAKTHVPQDRAVKTGEFHDPAAKTKLFRSYVVTKKAGITGDYLTQVSVQLDQEKNRHYVAFKFDPAGAKIFGDLTGDNIGHRLAIILDDTVDSAPVINSRIGDSGMISLGGYKTPQEILEDAKTLALVLKSGALAAPVVIRENRHIGASLGTESVYKGQLALLVGLLLVIFWMAVYYKWSGVVANVALVFNFIFLIAILAGLDATLTLPGMAGIALTLGMAIDANVIILERIREEIRHGQSAKTAIGIGYDKAFWTIFDAHVTACVAGIILWQYGSGPVRGFATTLIVGIAASLYTSIIITKMIYQYKMWTTKMETLSI